MIGDILESSISCAFIPLCLVTLQQLLSGVHIILIRSSDKDCEVRRKSHAEERYMRATEMYTPRRPWLTQIFALRSTRRKIKKAHVTILEANRLQRARRPDEASWKEELTICFVHEPQTPLNHEPRQ